MSLILIERRENKMERLIGVLKEINPDVDYEVVTNLIDGHYLDSLSILSLVALLEEEYDIEIPTVEIIPSNFNSAEAILRLVERLEED